MIGSSGTGSANNYTSLQNSVNSVSAEDMFRKLSADAAGSTALSVAKNKPQNAAAESEKSVKEQLKNNVVDLLKKSSSKEKDWPSLYGEDAVEEMALLYDARASITRSFDSLAVEVGAVGAKISKEQLIAFLGTLKVDNVNTDRSTEIAFVKNLIAQFEYISPDGEYITSFASVNEPQDYKTVTPEQVTPPIDLRV